MDVARRTRLRGRTRPRAAQRVPPVVVMKASCMLILLGVSTPRRQTASAYSFCRPPSPRCIIPAGQWTVMGPRGTPGGRRPFYSDSRRPMMINSGIFDFTSRCGNHHRHSSAGTLFAARRSGAWGDLDDDRGDGGGVGGASRRRDYHGDSYDGDGYHRMREDRRSDRPRKYEDYAVDDYDHDDWDDWTDDDEVDNDEDEVVEWETCPNSNAQVLLPPPRSEEDGGGHSSRPSPPRAVLHFVGGTGYGALPLSLTYGPFLERLCLRGNFVIINTPPLSSLEELTSPLDHRRVAVRARRRFDEAFETVVEDEYGKRVSKDVPIVAVGHSLGSRVLLILQMELFDSFDDEGEEDRYTRRRGRDDEEENYRVDEWRDVRGRRRSTGRGREEGSTGSAAVEDDHRRRRTTQTGRTADGTVLISFNNFEATRSVPGLYELGSWSRRALVSLKKNGRRRRSDGGGGDEWGRERRRSYDRDYDDPLTNARYREGGGGERMRRGRGRGRGRRRREQFYEDDYRDYDDWNLLLEEKFNQISDAVSDRLGRLASDTMNLEFNPSPRELVSAVRRRRRGSYPPGHHLADRTLLVQFDRDEIDQSASLARAMLDSSGSASASASSTVVSSDGGGGGRSSSASSSTPTGERLADAVDGGGGGGGSGLRFARLSGDHLTPIRGVSSLLDFDYGDDDYYDDDDEDYVLNGRWHDGTRRGRDRGDVPTSSSAPSPPPGRRRSREEEMDDLVSSIVRYVDMVVIGETSANDDVGMST